MTERPLLFFPEPVGLARRKLGGGAGGVKCPERSRQAQRLGPRFEELRRAFDEQRARVATDASGAAPEQVLVLETIGGVEDFQRAAERAALEWLGEFDWDDVSPDEDFRDAKDPEKKLPRRLYLTMANQGAIQQLLSLWESWRVGGKDALSRGLKKWGDLLACLRDVRIWGPRDRLEETGVLEDWQERVRREEETIRFQVELWSRAAAHVREHARDRIVSLLRGAGGRLVTECAIEAICYHGILAELPIAAVEAILRDRDAALVRVQDVMFFRPCVQAAVRPAPAEVGQRLAPRQRPLPAGAPVVALLDGMPIENHALLQGRLVVDDPDGWSASYPVQDREHGTAMASLIVHGDLGEDLPALPTPLYVRPLTKPAGFDGNRSEEIPADHLVVDAVHQAVRRICDPEAGGVASSVRVINLSLGDRFYPFHGFLSPWARLLDWLSAKYGVLFVVSAGNCGEDVELAATLDEVRAMDAATLQAATLTAIAVSARHRVVLAPAEGINVLTVGASHADGAAVDRPPHVWELVASSDLPAPYSRVGLGYRRAIKPDLLMPGGRAWHQESLRANGTARFTQVPGRRGAGLAHACPGPVGTNDHTGRSAGTSNAAAGCSRNLAFAHEVLQSLLVDGARERLLHGHEALLLRALAVHTADWGDAFNYLQPILAEHVDARRLRDHVARYVGYGVMRPSRMLECTAQRATILGFGSLADGSAHQFAVPVPPALGPHLGLKRFSATLAWFSPINPRHRGYKRAALWFDLPQRVLPVDRAQADWQAVQRGTLQHEVLEGDRASAVGDDASILVNVNCRAFAGELAEPVAYALVCSLEVGEGVAIPVYSEIRERLRIRVRARRPSPGRG